MNQSQEYIDHFFTIIATFSVLTIPIILTAYFAYRYNLLKPKKIKIDEDQLYNLYLPLVKFFILSKSDCYTNRIKQIMFFNKSMTIIEDNYELTTNELMTLYANLEEALNSKNEQSAKNEIAKIKEYVNYNYDNLKYRLGLPNAGFKSHIQRMTFKERLKYFSSTETGESLLRILCPIMLYVEFVKRFIIDGFLDGTYATLLPVSYLFILFEIIYETIHILGIATIFIIPSQYLLLLIKTLIKKYRLIIERTEK